MQPAGGALSYNIVTGIARTSSVPMIAPFLSKMVERLNFQ